MHSGVHARVADRQRERDEHGRERRQLLAAPVANAKAAALWPEGKEVERGILISAGRDGLQDGAGASAAWRGRWS